MFKIEKTAINSLKKWGKRALLLFKIKKKLFLNLINPLQHVYSSNKNSLPVVKCNVKLKCNSSFLHANCSHSLVSLQVSFQSGQIFFMSEWKSKKFLAVCHLQRTSGKTHRFSVKPKRSLALSDHGYYFNQEWLKELEDTTAVPPTKLRDKL